MYGRNAGVVGIGAAQAPCATSLRKVPIWAIAEAPGMLIATTRASRLVWAWAATMPPGNDAATSATPLANYTQLGGVLTVFGHRYAHLIPIQAGSGLGGPISL